VLDAMGEGTIEVGEAPLDPVPTDPNVALPGKPGRFHDGFRYPIHAAKVEAGRIRLEVDPGERFAPWCAIQHPYPNGSDFPPGYMCVSLGPYQRFTQGLPIDTPGTMTIPDIKGCAVWQVDPNDDPSNGVTLLNPM